MSRKIVIDKYQGNTVYSVSVFDSYGTEHHLGYWKNYDNAKLEDFTAIQMFIIKSEFSNAEINDAEIKQSWFQTSSFKNAKITNGNFDSITFISLDFTETDFQGTEFSILTR